MTIDRLAGFLTVGRELAAKLNVPLSDLTIVDFWPSAAGLRVAYRWQGMRPSDDLQESIPMAAADAERIMEATR